ncbi:hypothetical protein [Plastoroseomonas arctica]|uniref:Uncharacterized protein n=1 Tax=Plastoroseomonas arctica TaxID=1509237 RepID=A0AAF1KI43_9PROT|nr:hypothetical protein [Plastoroseomonas arctica]MBR0654719.1 hypothetical protein [Plastoroseomonas arctica]
MEPVENYCFICAATLPQGANPGLCQICSMKKASKSGPTGGAVQVVTWVSVSETANAVTANGNAHLKNVSDYIGAVMNCLTTHMSDNAATSAGGQYTIWNHAKEDTVSIDYQGTREGSGSTFWIDIQGQVGKDNARVSHWQIMVECAGSVPPQEVVMEAIKASLGVVVLKSPKNAAGIRIVIRRSTCTGLPNSQSNKSKK